jgi:phosphoribosylanthranilate isomerase
MDAFLAMKLTRHRSIQVVKTYTHEVQYQAAKTLKLSAIQLHGDMD